MFNECDTHTHTHRREQARRPAVNPNSKQAELLALVASEMNTFSNDGSFMEKFAASQAGVAGRQNGKAISDDDEEQALSGVCARLGFARSMCTA